jgi:hypothetical protein
VILSVLHIARFREIVRKFLPWSHPPFDIKSPILAETAGMQHQPDHCSPIPFKLGSAPLVCRALIPIKQRLAYLKLTP